ncbi:uncharacterized protein [Lolium perenne]|uniref:uncharacterized protein isoform X3 n=1 Tax=Lolium perenne TaxID=4522 RepID=UPI0021F5D78A|nr:uncharacterized protein LOC127331363 isoform X3 [Lolium perenne]
MEKSRVLVVGGTGYIGRRIVKASLAQGHETFVLMRPEIGLDIDKLLMLLVFKAQGARLVEASLDDHHALVAAVKQVDVVVSAMSGVHFRSHNLMLQLKLVEAIKEAGNVKKGPERKAKEELSPAEPQRGRRRSERHAGAPPHHLPYALDRESPLHGREVDATRLRRASALQRHRRRHASTHQHLQKLQRTEPPPRGLRKGKAKLHFSEEQQAWKGRRIRGGAPPEPHRQKRSPPTPKATPATPSSPRRRRLATHAPQDYIHAEIRGFPILPPPERPPEGEESDESPAASWSARGRPKIALSVTVGGESG